VRTLRVDFDAASFIAGNDPTHQITGDLDLADPDRLDADGWRRWVLADTGKVLSFRKGSGVAFAAGGAWQRASSPPGRPDRIIRLRR
jgi:hypothetical protein